MDLILILILSNANSDIPTQYIHTCTYNDTCTSLHVIKLTQLSVNFQTDLTLLLNAGQHWVYYLHETHTHTHIHTHAHIYSIHTHTYIYTLSSSSAAPSVKVATITRLIILPFFSACWVFLFPFRSVQFKMVSMRLGKPI